MNQTARTLTTTLLKQIKTGHPPPPQQQQQHYQQQQQQQQLPPPPLSSSYPYQQQQHQQQYQQPGAYPPPPSSSSSNTTPRPPGPYPSPSTPSQRVDPAQIPRPVDASNSGEGAGEGGVGGAPSTPLTYRTLTNGDKAPPSVTRPFIALDDGNCSPRFLRATTFYVPVSGEIAAQTKLPLALLCRPLATPAAGELPVPTVDYGETGPIRCTRYVPALLPSLSPSLPFSLGLPFFERPSTSSPPLT